MIPKTCWYCHRKLLQSWQNDFLPTHRPSLGVWRAYHIHRPANETDNPARMHAYMSRYVCTHVPDVCTHSFIASNPLKHVKRCAHVRTLSVCTCCDLPPLFRCSNGRPPIGPCRYGTHAPTSHGHLYFKNSLEKVAVGAESTTLVFDAGVTADTPLLLYEKCSGTCCRRLSDMSPATSYIRR